MFFVSSAMFADQNLQLLVVAKPYMALYDNTQTDNEIYKSDLYFRIYLVDKLQRPRDKTLG